jgi:hypothetical protein
MVCIVETILEDGESAVRERRKPLGPKGCGFLRGERKDRLSAGLLGQAFFPEAAIARLFWLILPFPRNLDFPGHPLRGSSSYPRAAGL